MWKRERIEGFCSMISILTSVYNRSVCMKELYQSLCNQSCHDFEWIIIDDGSSDGLFEFVNTWVREDSLFSIVYVYTKNGGKHRAINKGVKLSKGEYVFVVDSDDVLAVNAIEILYLHFTEIEKMDRCGGVCFPCYSKETGERIGKFPEGIINMDTGQLERFEHGLTGDICSCFKKTVLIKYPFPEYEGETFLSEGTSWFLMELDGYYFRIYDEPIYYCKYRIDGLTRNQGKLFCENPVGWASYIQTLNRHPNYNSKRYLLIFIEIMKDKYSGSEICQLLNLTYEEYESLFEVTCTFEEQLLSELGEKARVALYGGGINGWYITVILDKMKKSVDYVIDKNPQEIVFLPAINLNDFMPPVDVVIITSKYILDDCIAYVKSKMNTNIKIVKLASLCHEMWW